MTTVARIPRSPSPRARVRTFVLVWVLVTVLMGACTFAAIWTAYGALQDAQRNAPPSNDESVLAVALAQPTGLPPRVFPTAPPTQAITPTPPPTATSDAPPAPAQAQVVASPTVLPVNNQRFQAGIQVQVSFDGNQPLWVGEVVKLGLPWMKQQIRWELIEPEPGVYDWSAVDIGVEAAAEQGILLMFSVVTAPAWARESGAPLDENGPPADPQAYANFVTAMLERHPGRIHGVEVWNEQNIRREWASTRGLSAAAYVELLRVSYQAIKAVDPGVVVISGALAPTGVSDGVGAWDDFVYMDQMIDAGMLNYTDCVGAHHNGYNISPRYEWDSVPNDPTATFRGPFDNPHHSWSFRSTLQGYANAIQLADSDLKLCVTEFGWASVEDLSGFPRGFEFAQDNTLAEQATYTVEALTLMAEWDFVWLAFIWNLNYGPQAGWDPTNDNVPYSLIGNNFNFRPAYGAVQQWQAAFAEAQAGS